MRVRVEFLGMPRQYAQCDSIEVDANTIAQVLESLAESVPEVAEKCVAGSVLRDGYLLGVNGRFDNAEANRQLGPTDTLQILSADVGGH